MNSLNTIVKQTVKYSCNNGNYNTMYCSLGNSLCNKNCAILLLFSYVLGHEAMKKMGASNVLIAGMKGLGVEVGKSIKHCFTCTIILYMPLKVE